MSILQTLKDWSPIISPILSPAIAAVTAIVLFQRKEQERVHCTIEWRYVGHPDGQYEDPFLVVHNRSDRSVAIKDMRFIFGVLRRVRSEQTALGYGGRCAVSGETCTTILEAAHIQPFFSLASNHVQNGICLRVDVHRLFDAGLISINDNYDVMVSPLVDSSTVRMFDRRRIHTPNDPSLQPSRKALDFHRSKIFRA